MKYSWGIYLLIILSSSACTTFRQINFDTIRLSSYSQPLYSAESTGNNSARLLVNRPGYQLMIKQKRFYVFEDTAARAAFMASGKLPAQSDFYDCAVGPLGTMKLLNKATAKKKTAAAKLLATFKSMPLLLFQKSNDFFVWRYNKILYVIGKYTSNLQFEQYYSLPYNESRFDMGPNGEMVMFEIDNKNSRLEERLIAQFKELAWPLESNSKNYFVWKYRNRIYLIGDIKTDRLFAKNRFIIYSKEDLDMPHYSIRPGMPGSRIYLNAGHRGEMLVVEENPQRPKMTSRLLKKYLGDKQARRLLFSNHSTAPISESMLTRTVTLFN